MALTELRTPRLRLRAWRDSDREPFAALNAGAAVVEINPQPTPLSPHVTFSLNGAAGQILPALIAAAWGPAT